MLPWVLLTLAVGSEAWPTGAPRCVLEPGHGYSARRGSDTPTLLFSADCYRKGSPLHVTLTSNAAFHGFVIKAGDGSGGSFPYSGYNFKTAGSLTHCVTHDNAMEKMSVDVDFTPSDSAFGDIVVEAVVFTSAQPQAGGSGAAKGTYSNVREYLQPCQNAATSPVASVDCWGVAADEDNTGSCKDWVSASKCQTAGSYVRVSCAHSCCSVAGVRVPKTNNPATSFSVDSTTTASCYELFDGVGYESDCPGWVKANTAGCSGGWEAKNCKKSCCDAGHRVQHNGHGHQGVGQPRPPVGPAPPPTWTNTVATTASCYELYDGTGYETDCPGWVKANTAGCSGGWEAKNCKKSCCDAGHYVAHDGHAHQGVPSRQNTPRTASSFNSPAWNVATTASCYELYDGAGFESDCPGWVKANTAGCSGGWEAKNCKKSCCDSGHYVAHDGHAHQGVQTPTRRPAVGWSVDPVKTAWSSATTASCYELFDGAGYESDCPGWVKANTAGCSGGWEAKNCRKSCCDAGHRVEHNGHGHRGVGTQTTSWKSSSATTASCYVLYDGTGYESDCPGWVKANRDGCNGGWEGKNCEKSCCEAGFSVKQAVQPRPRVASSRNSDVVTTASCYELFDGTGYESDCPGWVKANTAGCSGGWEAKNCKKSCCDAGHVVKHNTHAHQGVQRNCQGKFDGDVQSCPGWVKSAADCAVGSYSYNNCHLSCCKVGVSTNARSNSANKLVNNADCEMDFDPGAHACPTGQSRWAQSREMWYHCPYCRKCKIFRWSGCGGNANRFETEAACESSCRGNNAWTEVLDAKFGDRNDACHGQVNSEPIGLAPICDGMVARNPAQCGGEGGRPTWISENCLKSCCKAGYTRRK